MISNEGSEKVLSPEEQAKLLGLLKGRFEQNIHRHEGIVWAKVQEKLKADTLKLWSLGEMGKTGGEPDVIDYDKSTGEYLFYDCSPQSPEGRRRACYDRAAAEKRPAPGGNAVDMANEMGIELLTEEQYRTLQKFGSFDTKTESWLKTPADIRKLGGAIFADCRYGHVFVFHNGAISWYTSRGFRGLLRV
jgi:hypothetical protein